jgi:hypothetical protein
MPPFENSDKFLAVVCTVSIAVLIRGMIICYMSGYDNREFGKRLDSGFGDITTTKLHSNHLESILGKTFCSLFLVSPHPGSRGPLER